jgi:DNA-binding IclR family transcriptional regulator
VERVKRAPRSTSPITVAKSPETNADAADRNTVAAVNRAIAILGAFHHTDKNLSLGELSERTGFYKSTILRLLHTLEQSNFIGRLTNGRYRLGHALLRLGLIYQRSFDLEDIITPQLKALVEATGESASFFISDGSSRICLHRVDSQQAVRHMGVVGDLLPLRRGASGEVLATFSNGAERVSRSAFNALPSVFVGKDPLDVSAIAGPVFSVGGKLEGAISISGPSTRFDASARRRAAKPLIEVLRLSTSRLGGDAGVFSPNRK